MRMTRPGELVLAAVALAALCWAWNYTLPPLSGYDEVDHAYRATAVVNGQILPQGCGGPAILAPAELAQAAQVPCSYDAMSAVNCVQPKPGVDTVAVGSSADSYSPVYYALVGWAALKAFPGDAASALRLMTSIWVMVVTLWATALWLRARRGGLEVLALLVSMTPMLAYSFAVIAPNGLEMAAGLLTWCSLLACARGDNTRAAVAGAVVGSLLLTTLRTFGPLWWLLTVIALLAWLDPGRRKALVRGVPVRLILGVGLLGCILSAGWTLLNRTNFIDTAAAARSPVSPVELATLVTVWTLQIIGAFPLRGIPAPPLVYLIWLAALAIALWVSLAKGHNRARAVVVVALLLPVLLPAVGTLMTSDWVGALWQGRYALPFAVGLPLLAASNIAASYLSPRATSWLIAALGVGHFASLRSVLEHSQSWYQPWADRSAWPLLAAAFIWSAAWIGMTLGPSWTPRRVTQSPGGPNELA